MFFRGLLLFLPMDFRSRVPLLIVPLLLLGCDRGGPNAVSGDTPRDRLRSIEQRIIADPTNASLFEERARLFEELDSVLAAMNDWKRAIALDSLNGGYHEALADLFYRKVRLEEAEYHLRRTIAVAPPAVSAKLKLGELLLAQRRYQPAMDVVNDALREDPQLAHGYYLKGWIHQETGDTNLAISSYRTSVERDPLFYKAHTQLGVLLSTRGDAVAMDHFNSALRVKPNGWEALYGKAMFAQENGMDSLALDCYARIKESDPLNPLAWYNTGYVLLEHLDRPADAVVEFTGAIERHPLYANAYYSRGLAHERAGDPQKAMDDALQALAIDPDMEDAQELARRLRSKGMVRR